MGLRNSYSSASLWNPGEGTLTPGAGLDQASTGNIDLNQYDQKAPSKYTGMAQGATGAMNAGGTAGQAITSAELMGMMSGASAAGPVGLAAGLGLTAYEQSKQAEAKNEQARVAEAQQRKADVQNALNTALGATRQLGV